MSRKYEKGSEVPTTVICQRLMELSEAITEGKKGIEREFTMRVPAELDRDPDLVLSIAASRLSRLQVENDRLLKLVEEATDKCLNSSINHFEAACKYDEVVEKLRTAEQRVARDCMEILDKSDWYLDAVLAVKKKYHLEDTDGA